jgi:hypothetical protein
MGQTCSRLLTVFGQKMQMFGMIIRDRRLGEQRKIISIISREAI